MSARDREALAGSKDVQRCFFPTVLRTELIESELLKK